MNNVVRSIKKFENEQMIHRSWNSISNNYTSVFKIGENNFLMYVFSRSAPRKVYKYTSEDGIIWGNLQSTTFLAKSGVNFEANVDTGFSERLDVSSGYFENGNLYMVLNSRSNSGFSVGYYIVKSDASSNYRTFVEVSYIPVKGALDSSPMLQKFKGKYYIFGRYRGSQDWGSVSAILQDRRAVRVNSADSIEGQENQWSEVGVIINNIDNVTSHKTSHENNILDPQRFYQRYYPQTGTVFKNFYEQSQIKGDYYGFVSYDADGTLIGVADTYFKNIQRPLIIRRDRSFDNNGNPVFGTGEEYPTLMITKNLDFEEGGIPFKAVADQNGNLTQTLAPDSAKRSINSLEYDIPSDYEKSQGFTGLEFGQFKPLMLVDAGDDILFYYANRIDTHYRSVSYSQSTAPGISYINNEDYQVICDLNTSYNKDVTRTTISLTNLNSTKEFKNNEVYYLINNDGSSQKVIINGDQTKAETELPNTFTLSIKSVKFDIAIESSAKLVDVGRLNQPQYSVELARDYVNRYSTRLEQIRSARGLNDTFNPEYEWVTITNRDIIKEVDPRKQNEISIYNEAYQKPTWIYVSSIKKNRFASWKYNGNNAYVDTKTLTIPANADYIEINHIGNITVSIIQGGVIVDTIGPVTGDEINSQLSIPSAYKGQSVKLRFNLLNTDSELFAFNFARIKPVSTGFQLKTPTNGATVPNAWTVFKWDAVAGETLETVYTVGITGDTNTNSPNDRVRTRSSISPGNYTTVLTSTNPTATAPSHSITIVEAVVSVNKDQITFYRSEGVSNYKVQFSTTPFPSNVNDPFTPFAEITFTYQADIDGLYPSGSITESLTSLTFPSGTIYCRMRAFVPGDDLEERPYVSSTYRTFTVAQSLIEAPTLLSPSNGGDITTSGNLQFTHVTSTPNVTSYGIQFSTSSNFNADKILVLPNNTPPSYEYTRTTGGGRLVGNTMTVPVDTMGVITNPPYLNQFIYWRVRVKVVDGITLDESQTTWSQSRQIMIKG